MKFATIFCSLGLLALISCGSHENQKKSDKQDKAVSVIDSLNKKVNDGHDLAMAKMGTIVRLQKAATSMVDSLQKLQPVNHAFVTRIQQADHQLEQIKGSMYTWMDNFDFDLKNMDSVQKVNYLKTNLKRILEIDDSTAEIISDAKSIMKVE